MGQLDHYKNYETVDPNAVKDAVMAEIKRKPYQYGVDMVYPMAFGALTAHYDSLKLEFSLLLDIAQDLENYKTALETAIEHQYQDQRDEIYAAFEIHYKRLVEHLGSIHRELRQDELDLGRVINDDERCSECDGFMHNPVMVDNVSYCKDCADIVLD